jgi:HK97 family phage portal protein
MGWLTGPRVERKTIGLQVPSGDQAVIPMPPFGGGKPNLDGMLYPDSSYETFARNGYGRNELVFACISEKAQSLPQSVLRVWPASSSGGEPVESHRLRELIAQPNPVTNEFEFFELSVTYLDLAGNCYWLVQRARDGLPAELWPLRPDLVRILPTLDPRVWRYGYVLDPSAAARGQEPDVVSIPPGDLIHIKYPNPLDAYFGQAPLRPASRASTLDNAATDFVDGLLRNDAVPRVVVTTQQEIDQTVADRLKAMWRRNTRRGEPSFLQMGMDVKVLGLNLRDLEFPDLRTISESRICMALGVPPILVGAKVGLDRSTFTNYGEARVSFWEETVMPLQRRFLEPVRTRLLPEFSGVGRSRVELRWDNSQVLALQESEQARWDRATNALARGGVTLNDFRRTVGLDPVENGDVFLMPAGVTPMPADGDLQPALPAPAADEGEGEGEDSQPPQLRAAALGYAEEFLAERKQLAARNGHGELARR